LFTNVPMEIAVDCVNEQWVFVSRDCPLPKEEFLGAIRFTLDSHFFLLTTYFINKTSALP